MSGAGRDPSDEDEPAVVTDTPAPRITRLYGAVDLEEHYPTTLVDHQQTRSVTAPSPIVGSMLTRYRIGDVLGQGGMGEVLSARDEQIGRPVAIKRLRVENPTPEVLARFLREARIQGRLDARRCPPEALASRPPRARGLHAATLAPCVRGGVPRDRVRTYPPGRPS